MVEQVDTLVATSIVIPVVEVKIDTSTLEGKREYLLREFNLANGPVRAMNDTIFDLNFDAHFDFVIGTHAMVEIPVIVSTQFRLIVSSQNQMLKTVICPSLY
ncbi:MAG: hypothetical protein ACJA0U_003588 [Salibacteraceae bacterium]